MENTEGTAAYVGRSPKELFSQIYLILLLGLQIYLFRRFLTSERIAEVYVYIGLIAFYLVVLSLLLYRVCTLKRRFRILMLPEAISLKDQHIEAGKIKAILIKGYFNPVIGIKPCGYVFVPYKYCFSFAEQEDQGIKELTEWANQRQIQVAHKRFARWL